MRTNVWSQNLNLRGNLREIGVDGSILKLMLKNKFVRIKTTFSCL